MARARVAAGESATAEATPLDFTLIEKLFEAWGFSWEEVKAKLQQAQDLHPEIPLHIGEVVGILDQYVTRTHILSMFQKAAPLLIEAFKTGISQNELDPSALS